MPREEESSPQAELAQARALMEAAMSPLARRVEDVLQSELDAITTLSRAEGRRRLSRLFERPPDVPPGPGMAREIVRAGGQRLITFLSRALGEDSAAIADALDDYVRSSERFLEPVLMRHLPGK